MNAMPLLTAERNFARELQRQYWAQSDALHSHLLEVRRHLNELQWDSVAAKRYFNEAYHCVDQVQRILGGYEAMQLLVKRYICEIDSARPKVSE